MFHTRGSGATVNNPDSNFCRGDRLPHLAKFTSYVLGSMPPFSGMRSCSFVVWLEGSTGGVSICDHLCFVYVCIGRVRLLPGLKKTPVVFSICDRLYVCTPWMNNRIRTRHSAWWTRRRPSKTGLGRVTAGATTVAAVAGAAGALADDSERLLADSQLPVKAAKPGRTGEGHG